MYAMRSSTMPLRRWVSEVARSVSKLIAMACDPYRPECHYMRGPGPKWFAKYGAPHLLRFAEGQLGFPARVSLLSLAGLPRGRSFPLPRTGRPFQGLLGDGGSDGLGGSLDRQTALRATFSTKRMSKTPWSTQ